MGLLARRRRAGHLGVGKRDSRHARAPAGPRRLPRRPAPPQAAAGYRVRRVLYHLGHYYTRGLYPDWHLRLFRRERARFGGHEPHASVQVEGAVGKLKAPILHFSYRDVADHVATINRLSSQAASEGDPGAMTVIKMIANPA